MVKYIKENLDDILKNKSKEEIQEIIDKTGNIPIEYLNEIINKETSFKANWTGAWDHLDNINFSEIKEINKGRGFENALFVNCDDGTFIYYEPFKIYNMSSETELLMFYTDSAIFLYNIKCISNES